MFARLPVNREQRHIESVRERREVRARREARKVPLPPQDVRALAEAAENLCLAIRAAMRKNMSDYNKGQDSRHNYRAAVCWILEHVPDETFLEEWRTLQESRRSR